MSFLYPRTITVTRPTTQTAVGTRGYSGLKSTNETSVVTGLPASIQWDSRGKTAEAGLPGDSTGRQQWRIYIPKGNAALGLINKDDIVTDDQGTRYQVTAPYWDSLGYSLIAETLKV